MAGEPRPGIRRMMEIDAFILIGGRSLVIRFFRESRMIPAIR